MTISYNINLGIMNKPNGKIFYVNVLNIYNLTQTNLWRVIKQQIWSVKGKKFDKN